MLFNMPNFYIIFDIYVGNRLMYAIYFNAYLFKNSYQEDFFNIVDKRIKRQIILAFETLSIIIHKCTKI